MKSFKSENLIDFINKFAERFKELGLGDAYTKANACEVRKDWVYNRETVEEHITLTFNAVIVRPREPKDDKFAGLERKDFIGISYDN